MTDSDNIKAAKKSLKAHIKFLKSLNDHIEKAKEPFLSRSMWATWCLHRYIEDRLVGDIEKAIKDHKE